MVPFTDFLEETLSRKVLKVIGKRGQHYRGRAYYSMRSKTRETISFGLNRGSRYFYEEERAGSWLKKGVPQDFVGLQDSDIMY